MPANRPCYQIRRVYYVLTLISNCLRLAKLTKSYSGLWRPGQA